MSAKKKPRARVKRVRLEDYEEALDLLEQAARADAFFTDTRMIKSNVVHALDALKRGTWK